MKKDTIPGKMVRKAGPSRANRNTVGKGTGWQRAGGMNHTKRGKGAGWGAMRERGQPRCEADGPEPGCLVLRLRLWVMGLRHEASHGVRGPVGLRPWCIDLGAGGRPEPSVASDTGEIGQVTSPLGALAWLSYLKPRRGLDLTIF